MPWPSRLLIQSAWCWFLLGLIIGLMLVANKVWGLTPWLWHLIKIHVHVLLVGFGMQWIMGAAYWLYPRRAIGYDRADLGMGWVWGLLNLGLSLRLLAEPFFEAGYFKSTSGAVLFTGALLQVVGGVLFVFFIRKRIWPGNPRTT